MDTIKLKSAEEILEKYWKNPFECNNLSLRIHKAIKEAQRNAIEYTLKVASENAEADYNITESFDRLTGENIEVCVINSSILNCKDKIFKENNL